MPPHALLTAPFLETHDSLFRDPVSESIAWKDISALLRQIGFVTTEPNGNVKVSYRKETRIFSAPHTLEFATPEEVQALREFIGKAEEGSAPEENLQRPQVLLVINHREARLYNSEMKGSVPEKLLPHDPGDFFRHAHNSLGFSRGKEKPDPNAFFSPVAKALQGAGEILIFGTGKGMSSEMDQFIAWTKVNHPDIHRRILGSVVIDETHLTEGQLLATAREFYANTARPRRPDSFL